MFLSHCFFFCLFFTKPLHYFLPSNFISLFIEITCPRCSSRQKNLPQFLVSLNASSSLPIVSYFPYVLINFNSPPPSFEFSIATLIVLFLLSSIYSYFLINPPTIPFIAYLISSMFPYYTSFQFHLYNLPPVSTIYVTTSHGYLLLPLFRALRSVVVSFLLPHIPLLLLLFTPIIYIITPVLAAAPDIFIIFLQ